MCFDTQTRKNKSDRRSKKKEIKKSQKIWLILSNNVLQFTLLLLTPHWSIKIRHIQSWVSREPPKKCTTRDEGSKKPKWTNPLQSDLICFGSLFEFRLCSWVLVFVWVISSNVIKQWRKKLTSWPSFDMPFWWLHHLHCDQCRESCKSLFPFRFFNVIVL